MTGWLVDRFMRNKFFGEPCPHIRDIVMMLFIHLCHGGVAVNVHFTETLSV